MTETPLWSITNSETWMLILIPRYSTKIFYRLNLYDNIRNSLCLSVLGFDVPVGATMLVSAWAIGRDPMHWDKAEEFMPERFDLNTIDFKRADFEYIPFGAGRRMCAGMTFGLANMELALASLLYHFEWELPHGMAAVDPDMIEVVTVTSRRKHDLLVVPVVRVPI
ncbi:hypothetical protein VPH35_033662 [Triticum aestivum]